MVGILKVKGSSTEKILSTVVVVVLEGKEKRRSFFWEKREKEKSTFFRCMLSKRIHPDEFTRVLSEQLLSCDRELVLVLLAEPAWHSPKIFPPAVDSSPDSSGSPAFRYCL